MNPREDLIELATALADWVAPAPSFTIYLFGSRVRGDHGPNSDVDVVIDFGKAEAEDLAWWMLVNDDMFKSINAKLPGPLKILENNDPLSLSVRNARAVHKERQVICVWMKPKPK